MIRMTEIVDKLKETDLHWDAKCEIIEQFSLIETDNQVTPDMARKIMKWLIIVLNGDKIRSSHDNSGMTILTSSAGKLTFNISVWFDLDLFFKYEYNGGYEELSIKKTSRTRLDYYEKLKDADEGIYLRRRVYDNKKLSSLVLSDTTTTREIDIYDDHAIVLSHNFIGKYYKYYYLDNFRCPYDRINPQDCVDGNHFYAEEIKQEEYSRIYQKHIKNNN